MVVTGPRRAGKTTLLRRLFPLASYVLLEDPDVQARARSDPRGLLEGLRLPALFDEIQNVPELFSYIRTRIDESPSRTGQWLFTGSQEAPFMQGVTESMAGRAAIIHLKAASPVPIKTVAPQVEAFDVHDFLEALTGEAARGEAAPNNASWRRYHGMSPP